MKRTIVIISVAIVLLLIGAIYMFTSKPMDKTPSNSSNSDNGNSISIKDFAFSPTTLTVAVGETVTWTNFDSVQHTVTSDSGTELDSALLPKGQTYSHTFNTLGEFAYHCTPHPNMKAKIIVQ